MKMPKITKEEKKVIIAMERVLSFEEISKKTDISQKRLSPIMDELEDRGIVSWK